MKKFISKSYFPVISCITGLCYFSNILVAQNINYRLTNIRAVAIPPEEQDYSEPVWSPDGKKLLFTTPTYGGLYVVYLDSNNSVKQINDADRAGYGASWTMDSKKIFYGHKKYNKDYIRTKKPYSYIEVKSVNIETGEISEHPEVIPGSLRSVCSAKKNNDIIIYINLETLLIEATTLDKSRTWVVTTDPGRYYNAILSPDKTKIVVAKDTENDLFIYATDGSGMINKLGLTHHLADTWSFDSKKILCHLSEDDGHQLTGSELYICNADGSAMWQLTNTPDIFEMRPSWSSDNKHIAYVDDKTGIIYIAELIH